MAGNTNITVSTPASGSSLSCGGQNQDYTVQVNVQQAVEKCADFDFSYLYNLAEQIVTQNLAGVTCADPCKRLGPYLIGQTWQCSGTVAQVQLAERVYCSKEADIKGTFQKPPDRAGLLQPGSGGTIPDPPGNDSTIIDPLRIPPCGECVQVHLVYRQPVSGCDNFDSSPFIKAANDRVDKFVASVKCTPPCTPKAEDRRSSAKCEGKVAIATVEFRLCCVKPAIIQDPPPEPH